MKRKEINIPSLLNTYTFDEILEMSDLTQEEVLILLHESGLLKCPEVLPL